MTSLRDAYPAASGIASSPGHVPPPMPAPHGGMPNSGSGVPHGPMGGVQAGSMENKMPIEQIDGRQPMEQFLRNPPAQSQSQAYPQSQPYAYGNSQTDAAAAHAAQAAAEANAIRQRQAAYQAAENKMRGIAKEENRMQAVGYVAMGMCLVFVAIFVIQMRNGMGVAGHI